MNGAEFPVKLRSQNQLACCITSRGHKISPGLAAYNAVVPNANKFGDARVEAVLLAAAAALGALEAIAVSGMLSLSHHDSMYSWH